MIKAIIADVDGVIVGKQPGVNFPLPNERVIRKLRQVHEGGVPVVLCTAKFNYAVRKIIEQAGLRGPHITDGGALIIDPLDHKIVQKHVLDKRLARDIISASLEGKLYTEVYGADEYYIEKMQISPFTEKRLRVLQKESRAVTSLVDEVASLDVIKIIAFAEDVADKARVEKVLRDFIPRINLLWTLHPSHLPFQAGIITVKGVSKKQAAGEVLKHLGVTPAETLGVGDTLGDWNFMSECGYAATVGNESEELKDLARSKGEGHYFLARSVDDDGMIDVLDHFMK